MQNKTIGHKTKKGHTAKLSEKKTKNTSKTKNNHTENKNRERRKIQPTFKGSIHPKEKEYKNKIQQRGEISHLTRKWISETLGQDSENYKKRPSKTTCDHYANTAVTENKIAKQAHAFTKQGRNACARRQRNNDAMDAMGRGELLQTGDRN